MMSGEGIVACGFTCGAKKVTSWQVHRFIRAPITNRNWVVAPTGSTTESKRLCCWTLALWAIRVIFQFLSRLSLERSKCKMINIPSEAKPQREFVLICTRDSAHPELNRIQELLLLLLQWSSRFPPPPPTPDLSSVVFPPCQDTCDVIFPLLMGPTPDSLPLTVCVHHIHLKWPA